MGRKSKQELQEIEFDAKRILNENNIHPYSDDEIKEIIKFLESFATIFCDCILSKMK